MDTRQSFHLICSRSEPSLTSFGCCGRTRSRRPRTPSSARLPPPCLRPTPLTAEKAFHYSCFIFALPVVSSPEHGGGVSANRRAGRCSRPSGTASPASGCRHRPSGPPAAEAGTRSPPPGWADWADRTGDQLGPAAPPCGQEA